MPIATLASRRRSPRVVVVGDLLLDVVLMPERQPFTGVVPGRVALYQGGGGATTARWLAREGVATRLVTSVGRDAVGRALIELVRSQGVEVYAARPVGLRTGRTGIVRLPNGDRALVSDRGAADALGPEALKPAWFAAIDALHLPGHGLLVEPLRDAIREATRLGRAAGATVSLDLASSEAVEAAGRRRALAAIAELAPDVVFGTPAEVQALLPGRPFEALLDLAPVAVVKRGANGAAALALHDQARIRIDVATEPQEVVDPTGAGDAFVAGFLAAWLEERREHGGRLALHRGVAAGHRAAARHLQRGRVEVRLG